MYPSHLAPPASRVDAVLDTDTYNEIDDQFALSYLIRSPERVNVKALYAAPFWNANSSSPADGMEKSYAEILKLLDLLGRTEYEKSTFRGADRYLPDEKTPVASDAAKDLVRLASGYTSERPLYVIAIGAITNVASAILMDPSICDKIVVVWLGGHARHWRHTKEFNMFQDVAAARVVFSSGVSLVQLPCCGVVSAFSISGDDMIVRLKGKNRLCDYLVSHTEEEIYRYLDRNDPWSRVIWDVTAVAWLTGGQGEEGKNVFMDYEILPRPIPEYDHTYSFPEDGAPYVYVREIYRDALWRDLVKKLTE